MSTHIKIISEKESQAFDNPPYFSGEERKKYFSVPIWAIKVLETFRTPTNKTGFILQLGYFKAVNKFFVANKFHRIDFEFVERRLEFSPEEVNLEDYWDRTFERHQEIILKNLGYRKFNEEAKYLLIQETLLLCSKQTKPRLMFLSLVEFLQHKKIEVPTYYAISDIITQALREFEKELMLSLDLNLLMEDRKILDTLLKEDREYGVNCPSPLKGTLRN